MAIIVKDVSKSFRLPHERHSGLKQLLLNVFRRPRRYRHGYETQHVLKDISFEVKKGDFFGIVGRNGSGKSTLLKLLASIYTPDTGSITIDGSLTPFIELGVGFNPELTGRENVYLNGALLGFGRKEMDEMYDDIVEFAELEKFMDQKLKNYSSGMQVRLAFSIAIRANSAILLLDEVLAVGDYGFQQKCFEYFKQLKRDKRTVVLVSHDANALQMYCDKAVLIENGAVKVKGSISKVLEEYAKQNSEDMQDPSLVRDTNSLSHSDGRVVINELRIQNTAQATSQSFLPADDIHITIDFMFKEETVNPVFGLAIHDGAGGKAVFAANTLDQDMKTGIFKKGQTTQVTFIVNNRFDDGKYYVSGAVASTDRSNLYLRFMNAAAFFSVGWKNTAKAMVYQDSKITISKSK